MIIYQSFYSQYLQRMERSNSMMGRPISGSKPRKHITKMSYDNPSLVSNSVTALFKYPVMQPQSQNSKPTLISKYTDSLSKAEHEFVQRKDQIIKRQQKTDNTQAPYASVAPFERRNSSPLMLPSASIIDNNRYNFLNHESIKSKQNHGYNIINCFPNVK